MATRRKYSPIFNAEVTFGEIIVGTTKNGHDYARSMSKVHYPNGQTGERQVMAFAKRYENVKDLLIAGETVRLAVQHDEGTMLIIGRPLKPKKAA